MNEPATETYLERPGILRRKNKNGRQKKEPGRDRIPIEAALLIVMTFLSLSASYEDDSKQHLKTRR